MLCANTINKNINVPNVVEIIYANIKKEKIDVKIVVEVNIVVMIKIRIIVRYAMVDIYANLFGAKLYVIQNTRVVVCLALLIIQKIIVTLLNGIIKLKKKM